MMNSFRCVNLALFLLVSQWTERSWGIQCYQESCKTTEQDRDGKAINVEGEKDSISVLTTRKFLGVRLQTPFVLVLP